jgi:hypothetical protein
MPWNCIMLTATEQASLSLRRYTNDRSCSAHTHGYHNAHTHIGTAPVVHLDRGCWDVDYPQPPHSDPRWPVQCVCGYHFQESDAWQVTKNRMYTCDTGEQLTLSEARPGMIWDAEWLLDFDDPWAGPDGRCLMCRLPDGSDWCIDGPSRSGGKWTRTGEPPRLTVQPSIASPGYHGFLVDGVLSDDIEGRTY